MRNFSTSLMVQLFYFMYFVYKIYSNITHKSVRKKMQEEHRYEDKIDERKIELMTSNFLRLFYVSIDFSLKYWHLFYCIQIGVFIVLSNSWLDKLARNGTVSFANSANVFIFRISFRCHVTSYGLHVIRHLFRLFM